MKEERDGDPAFDDDAGGQQAKKKKVVTIPPSKRARKVTTMTQMIEDSEKTIEGFQDAEGLSGIKVSTVTSNIGKFQKYLDEEVALTTKSNATDDIKPALQVLKDLRNHMVLFECMKGLGESVFGANVYAADGTTAITTIEPW